jgi:hypothetical protein
MRLGAKKEQLGNLTISQFENARKNLKLVEMSLEFRYSDLDII